MTPRLRETLKSLLFALSGGCLLATAIDRRDLYPGSWLAWAVGITSVVFAAQLVRVIWFPHLPMVAGPRRATSAQPADGLRGTPTSEAGSSR